MTWEHLGKHSNLFCFCLQASLALTLASEKVPTGGTVEVPAEKEVVQATPEEVPVPKEKTSSSNGRKGRQYYGPVDQGNNEVVVDIEDDEKSQYYETNYDTSKYETFTGLYFPVTGSWILYDE